MFIANYVLFLRELQADNNDKDFHFTGKKIVKMHNHDYAKARY